MGLTVKALICAAALALSTAAGAGCLPLDLGGSGTRMVMSSNDSGAAVGWWCPGLTTPTLSLYAGRWPALTEDLRSRLASIGASSDKLAAIDQVRAAWATVPLDELRDVWGGLRIDLIATRPPPSSWVVAPAPATANPRGTRPTYSLVGATLVPTGRRVTQGSPCDCSRHFVQGTSTSCQVAPAPDMAVCSRID
jgi:hypothetical protein